MRYPRVVSGTSSDPGDPSVYYEALFDLLEHADPRTLLPAALDLLLTQTQATFARVELADIRGGVADWQASNLPPELDTVVRDRISRGIIGEAVALGRSIRTNSAQADPRFDAFDSVKNKKLEAIFCAPIVGATVRGVVYLEKRSGAGRITDAEEGRAVRLAKVLAARGDALLPERVVSAPTHPALQRLAARSAPMVELCKRLQVLAGLDTTVLFTGPTGTGKTMLARTLHELSPRASAPFVEVNCATLPEALFESEVFGAARGAHSAVAHGAVVGRVESAQGGTLFLDEVAELSLVAQAKLLQFLESRTYHRLADPKPRTADVKVVSATNVSLDEAVATKRFREDLLHRLRVVEVAVPPLCDRIEDLPALVADACDAIRPRHRDFSFQLSPSARAALETHSFPGNVRELHSLIERGVVAARMRLSNVVDAVDLFGASAPTERNVSLEAQLRVHRARILRTALEDCDWNVGETAKRLDVARSYLYKLIAAHELTSPTKGA